LFDDLGVQDQGYLGAADLETPNIDRLAAGGTVCRNWYSNAPVCAPARCAFAYGPLSHSRGCSQQWGSVAPLRSDSGFRPKKAGYITGITGKWHLGNTPNTVPNAHGFDYSYGFHEGCVDYFCHRYYWGEHKVANFHDLGRNREEIFEDGQYLTERIGQEACSFLSRVPADQPFFLYTAFRAVHYPMHAQRNM